MDACKHALLLLAIIGIKTLQRPCSAAQTLRSRSLIQYGGAAFAAEEAPSPGQNVPFRECTPPRNHTDALRPFCFVPPSASPRARQFLLQAAAGRASSRVQEECKQGLSPKDCPSGLQHMREFYHEFSVRDSNAIVSTMLQQMRNDTIAGVPVAVGTPKGVDSSSPADTKLLLYLHGGGYTIGSCYHQWSTSVPTAIRAGLTVMCVEYRLAPEHPFPAALNDAISVYKELLKQGYDSKRIVLLGDSAGGGLVAAITIQLQREQQPLPAALGMFSPWVQPNPKAELDSRITLVAVDPVISAPDAPGDAELVLAYVNNNESLFMDPLVSPGLADWAELFPDGQLPPVLIQVGLRELLLSEAVQLYHRMKEAAPTPGHVTLSPYDIMWHVFQATFKLPEATAAHHEMADFFSRALNGTMCKTS